MSEFNEDYLPKGGLPIMPRCAKEDISSVTNGIILKSWLRTGQVTPDELSETQKYYAGLTKIK